MKLLLFCSTLLMTLLTFSQQEPIRIGVIGLTHTHVHWIFGSQERGDFILAGIVEPNRELANRYADQYDYPMDQIYPSMEALIQAQSIDAVTAFGTIYAHLEIVEFFAPKGIHVMVEKPLAVNMKHAKKMKSIADTHGIHLLTNYETTWYPTNHKAFELVAENKVGAVRKVIVRDGHRGPKKIGVDDEFLVWLTDPELNGGGAITDFGCYGANLLTWLQQGKRPKSVTAITQQLQPENNPDVDDEAIILVQYDDLVGVVQASWNWPIGRKDMEIHGLTGTIFSDNRNRIRVRIAEGYDGFEEEAAQLPERNAPFDDPFSYFAAVINGEVEVEKYALSSLENNMIVMEILDAARKSAEKGKSISLD